jgi:serine/threonine protein kinase
MLVFEDTGAQSLHDVMAGGALPWARRCACRSDRRRAQRNPPRIIHKDINPHNIVVNDASGDLMIIDFGASSRLSREQQTIVAPNVLAGTLTYISSE